MPSDLRLIVLAPLAVMLSAADAPHPMLQRAFGNTVVSTYADGREGRLWLAPSGAYAALGPPGDRTLGRWWLKGNRLCLKQDVPATLPFLRYCTRLPTQEPWITRAITGETIQVRVASGAAGAPVPWAAANLRYAPAGALALAQEDAQAAR